MDRYELVNGNVRMGAPSGLCSKTEFTQQTEEPNGSVLMVIDETTHMVDGYYIAFNGYWNEL